jgi:Zn-finger nucleic acid-binding protein
MTSYERNGVTIDQCAECRGIFLDRGELERLIDAEVAFYQPSAAAAPAMAEQQWVGGKQHGGGHGDRGSHGNSGYGGGRRKRGGFLGELLG